MTECLSVSEAATRLGCSKGHIQRLCREGKLPGSTGDGGIWTIPATSHPRLADDSIQKLTESGELLDIPSHKREEAMRRLGIIQEAMSLAIKWQKEGRKQREAFSYYCQTHTPPLSLRTLQRWINQWKNEGLVGLIDTRGGGRFESEIINAEAFELFKSMYLTQEQRSVKQCLQMVRFFDKDQGTDWKIPPIRTMYRLVEDRIPKYVSVLKREGMNAYEAQCAPYIISDPDSIEPGQIWMGDHSQFNCWIRYRNRWIRPWLTAWIDVRSRMIVGWWISPNPNQTTILLAFKRGAAEYGPPESVKIDNGRDYSSELWTGTHLTRNKALAKGYIDTPWVAGLYAMMNVAVSFAIPYNPKGKAIMERWFDTEDNQFTKTIPTYCGKDTARKPEELRDLLSSDAGIQNAYSLEDFAVQFSRYIEVYNKSAHTGAGMNGDSPEQVFNTRRSRRVMADGVLDLIARVWSPELTVGKNGVKFKGLWYGQYDMNLLAHQGRKVRVAYDPDDMRQVYVYDAVTQRLILIAEQARLMSYGNRVDEEHLREAMSKKAKAIKSIRQFSDSNLIANMNLTDLAMQAMADATEKAREPEPPMPATIRPVRTVFDDQVKEHARQNVIKQVRRAAGGEAITHVLDMDFNLLKPEKPSGVRLFDDREGHPEGA
jgi:excisionase family DNA binding protein